VVHWFFDRSAELLRVCGAVLTPPDDDLIEATLVLLSHFCDLNAVAVLAQMRRIGLVGSDARLAEAILWRGQSKMTESRCRVARAFIGFVSKLQRALLSWGPEARLLEEPPIKELC
jgi:hypothetical protein